MVLDDPDSIVYDAAGYQLSAQKANKCAGFVEDAFDGAIKYSKEHSSMINSRRSVFDYVREKVRRSNFNAEHKSICEQMVFAYNSEIGDPIETQSLKFFYLEDGIDGADAFVASTYKNIVLQIGEAATSARVIRFHQEIIKVQSFPRSLDRKSVAVETATGEIELFDEIVVTCPLGWLKRHKTAFSPSIPLVLERAIDRIGYGALEKVFVTFPAAFWQEATDKGDTGSSLGEREKNSDKASGFIFWHFLSPSYHPLTKEIGPWTQEFVALSGLPGINAHPTLVFYVAPPCSRHLIPSITNITHHSKAYNELLRSFAEPFYSRIPNYDPNNSDCLPTWFLSTQWQNDPFAGHGSYISFQVGLENADEDLRILRSGGGKGVLGNNLMGDDRGVWFAGEHTAPLCGLGTTTGAWWSGERAARDILNCYGIKKRMKKDGIGPVVS